MMMLAKLKSAAVALVALVAVAGGVMLGTMPVLADDPATPKPATKIDPTTPGLGPNLSDEEFLKRICLDLRGTPANPVEVAYFVADPDPAKRKKVVGWLTEPEVASAATDNAVRLWNLRKKNAFVPRRINLNTIPNMSLRVYPDQTSGVIQWINELHWTPDMTPDMRLDLTANSPLAQWLVAGELVNDTFWVEGPAALWVYGDNLADQRHTIYWTAQQPQTDEQFLTKVCQDARGAAPTRIEREYFLTDKDPKKREKLIDLILKDAAVAKKVGPNWKQSLLNPERTQYLRYRAMLLKRPVDRFETLLGQLLDGKRTDDQVLDGLSAAVLGRLPTESERKLILANIAKAPDKAAAWREVIGTLSGTDEAKQHADALKARTTGKK